VTDQPPIKRAFYDPAVFPALLPLRDQWPAMRDELLTNLHRIVSIPSPQYELMSPGSTWKKLELYAWGLPVRRNLEALPTTAALVLSVPKLMQAAFYMLGPRSHLLPHTGVTDMVLRCHIGVVCPSEGCELRVGTETRAEGNGRLLVFDDTLEHEAWNRTDAERYVLHLDVFRPEVPLDERAIRWMKELRLRIVRTYPSVLPHALAAGIDIDSEAIQWFRAMNLTFRDPAAYTPEQWRRFEETVYPA
jgi:aspartyl/asparaginyl beta-hydroxylase (cupin superfamily)